LPLKAPVAGFNWVLRQIQTMANDELLNDQPWKERLIELQMQLEIGEITEEDYAVEEAIVFRRLREIRQLQQEMMEELLGGQEDEEPGIDVHTGYGE
jgi:hypothetical protein